MMKLNRVALRATFVGVSAAALIQACSADAPEDVTQEPLSPGAVAAREEATESLTMDLEELIAHASRNGDALHVDLFTRDGQSVFSADLGQGTPDEDNVHWVWQAGTRDISEADASAASGALTVPFETSPTLEQGVQLVATLQAQVAAARAGDDYDNFGCDLPFPTVSSCGGWGICCDIHDACYAQFDCSASSWINPFASLACKGCNAAFLVCAAGPIKLPSICCLEGNCGEPR